MDPITYYTRDEEEFGVLALTRKELEGVSDALDFALDEDPVVDSITADNIRKVVEKGIQHLKGREADPDGL